MRAETAFDLVVCALDSALVSGLDSELERRPEGELRLKANFQDPAARQLMTLLVADANDGQKTERLYTEHLAQALAVRMLFFGRGSQPPSNNNGRTAGLPKTRLTVIERGCLILIESVVLLPTSNGSRVHFVRCRRQRPGPAHNYLLHLRLERVQELLKNPSMSLIDIALDCGFSSHSHMSRLFHKFVGVTPSDYRRGLWP